MEEIEKRESEITKQLILELQSDNDVTVIGALKKTKDKGSAIVIPILLNIYPNKSEEIQIEIKTILGELKISSALPELIASLKNANDEIAELILGSIWSSNLDASDYIAEIVSSACRNGYMTAFEALTVLENLEGPFEEEKIIEAKLELNDYFSKKDKKEKDTLVKSILEIVLKMEESLMG